MNTKLKLLLTPDPSEGSSSTLSNGLVTLHQRISGFLLRSYLMQLTQLPLSTSLTPLPFPLPLSSLTMVVDLKKGGGNFPSMSFILIHFLAFATLIAIYTLVCYYLAVHFLLP